MIFQLDQKVPKIPDTCFIAPTASVIGDVMMQDNASVWFNCVLRADNEPIHVGENTNVQDGSILHVDPGYPIRLHANVTVGHKAMLHGCTIGEYSLVGMNAVVLNGARIGKHCLVGANALITENTEIPDGHMVLSSPAKIIKPLDEQTLESLRHAAQRYVRHGKLYASKLKRID